MIQSKLWWGLWLLLSALSSTAGYSQNSAFDSTCYSVTENMGITRALMELKALRSQDSAYVYALAYYQTRREQMFALLNAYEQKRCFLCAFRKRIRKLRAELSK